MGSLISLRVSVRIELNGRTPVGIGELNCLLLAKTQPLVSEVVSGTMQYNIPRGLIKTEHLCGIELCSKNVISELEKAESTLGKE